jgi:RNA recognition motif-containing protein
MQEDSKQTVFVAGLPEDVKERELNLLFRDQPGFVGVNLKRDPVGRHVAFASFVDNNHALQAIGALHDMAFDPTNPTRRLRLDLAKSNSRVVSTKRNRDGEVDVPPSKHARDTRGDAYNMAYGWVGYAPFAGMPAAPTAPPPMAPISSTVFISGLGPYMTSQAITEICATIPGFVRLKVDHEGQANACCFALYQSPNDAGSALARLQGYSIPDKAAVLRCEYARQDLGSKGTTAPPAPVPPMHQYAPPPPMGASSSTLFVSGLGYSVNTNDMQALCSNFPGFDRLKVDHEGQRNACCFVLFGTPHDAAAALPRLSGHTILGTSPGATGPNTLRCEFAKSDLGAKQDTLGIPQFHAEPFYQSSRTPMYPGPAAAFQHGSRTTTGSTLFVTGLGPEVSSNDMQAASGSLSGFKRLKVDHEGAGNACCFVLFDSPVSAAAALAQLNGIEMNGKILRAEYAKSDLGKKYGGY